VPEPGVLADEDKALLDEVEKGFETVGSELEAVRLRSALNEAMRLASEVNKYLDKSAPWKMVKTDKNQAGRAIYVAIKAINSLKVLFAPFLPFTSQKLHQFLGYDGQLFGNQYTKSFEDAVGEHSALLYDPSNAVGKWEKSELNPGHKFLKPEPLFIKLDKSIVEEERGRLGK